MKDYVLRCKLMEACKVKSSLYKNEYKEIHFTFTEKYDYRKLI